MTDLRQAKEDVKQLLRSDASVRGVGITWSGGRQCILVNVATGAKQSVVQQIASNLKDIDFVIQEVSDVHTE